MFEDISKLPKKHFSNQKCYRLIPSKFPPIYLFDDVSSESEFEALYNIQSITNPRIQDEVGNIDLVPKNQRVYGIPGCGYIMAAFTHINPMGSRFSNGMYGVYYAASLVNTAIKETIYHRELFLQATNEPAQNLDMRCLVSVFSGNLVNITKDYQQHSELYHKTLYSESQKFGDNLRSNNENGIYYNSVRSQNGKNYAIFKPTLFKNCIQQAHYVYRYNGNKIVHVYKKELVMEL